MTTVLPYPRTETTAPTAVYVPLHLRRYPWSITRDWDALGQPVIAQHIPSGLSVAYTQTSRWKVEDRVASGRAAADILDRAADIYADPGASAEDMAAAEIAAMMLADRQCGHRGCRTPRQGLDVCGDDLNCCGNHDCDTTV